MNFAVRTAEISDVSGIADIHVKTWQSHYRGHMPDTYLDNLSIKKRTARWKSSLSDPKPGILTFVAESKGNIIGFCSIGPSRDSTESKNTGEMYAIYVSPDEQGHGVGTALMEKGLFSLKNEGYVAAMLWVLVTNKTTIDYYKSKGWKPSGQKKSDEMCGFTIEEEKYVIIL
ncbi:MAG: GNAT family N-acetyltransferase [Candidatus Paceibacterota bacterium]|jgi:ribosomal protein S18 acetylase RimI-like enzyme